MWRTFFWDEIIVDHFSPKLPKLIEYTFFFRIIFPSKYFGWFQNRTIYQDELDAEEHFFVCHPTFQTSAVEFFSIKGLFCSLMVWFSNEIVMVVLSTLPFLARTCSVNFSIFSLGMSSCLTSWTTWVISGDFLILFLQFDTWGTCPLVWGGVIFWNGELKLTKTIWDEMCKKYKRKYSEIHATVFKFGKIDD